MAEISLVKLFLPNLGTTLVGMIYLIVGIALFLLAKFFKIPLLDGIVTVVGVGLILFGVFEIFIVYFIEDILNNLVALSIVLSSLLVGVAYYLLFKQKVRK